MVFSFDKRQTTWGLPYRQGSIHSRCSVRITFDVSRQLVERGEACLLRRLLRPRAQWLAGRGEACLLLLIVYWFIGPHCILCQILTID